MVPVDTLLAVDLGRLVTEYGYLMVAGLVFFDSFGLPVAGDVAMIFAATMAAEGKLHLSLVVLIAFVAAIATDTTMYWLSRRGLRGVWQRMLRGRGLSYIEGYFDRHGASTLIIARPVPAFRTKVAILAGMSDLPYRRFAPMNLLGVILWLAIITPIGYYFGVRAKDWVDHIASGSSYAVAALVVALAVWLVVRWVRGRRQQAPR